MLSQLSYDPNYKIKTSLTNPVFDVNDPEETRTLDLRRDRAAL
jgi:hypothetical protein